jgi:hypothetical protein
MVRFTLRDGRRDASIRMEMSGREKVQEIRETVEEYWGDRRVMLVNNYVLLDTSKSIGESIDEDDIVDVIPYIG